MSNCLIDPVSHPEFVAPTVKPRPRFVWRTVAKTGRSHAWRDPGVLPEGAGGTAREAIQNLFTPGRPLCRSSIGYAWTEPTKASDVRCDRCIRIVEERLDRWGSE